MKKNLATFPLSYQLQFSVVENEVFCFLLGLEILGNVTRNVRKIIICRIVKRPGLYRSRILEGGRSLVLERGSDVI